MALGQGDAIVASYNRIVEAEMIGGTPTNAAMDVARDTLLPRDPDDESVPYIILVTDGDPNCLFSDEPGQTATDMDRMGVTERITALATDDVNTYVVGYNFTGGIGTTGTH